MQHVDDGTIHAWLDGQITDRAEAASIEAHLGACAVCSARLAEERSTRDRAQALLAAAAPFGERPSFDALMEKVGMEKAGSRDPGSDDLSTVRSAVGSTWMLRAGWAASLALAVGLGWTAREITQRPGAAPAVMERAAADTSSPADRAAAPPPAAGAGASSAPEPQRAEVEARPVEAVAPASEPDAPRQIADAAPRLPEPDAPVDRPALAQEAAPPVATGISDAAALAPPVAGPPPLPAAPPPPSAVGPRLEERVTFIGANPLTAFAPAIPTEWQPLARTAAAARTGMPLYGIDGLEPVLTSVSTDGLLVRTMYRLEPGETVELVQERIAPERERGVVDLQATRRLFTLEPAARGGVLYAPSATPRLWSGVRGDVRIILRTTSQAADLDALGAKLRVD